MADDARLQTIAELAQQVNKKYGEDTMIIGSAARKDVPRLSTGILAYDLAFGGGWPKNQWSEVIATPTFGKGLALDTPVPGPYGWQIMGVLCPGDTIFGADGQPVTVSFVSEIHHRPCYKVTFGDGTSLVTDDQHRWSMHHTPVVSRYASDRIVSTQEMADAGVERPRLGGGYQWCAPVCSPVQYPTHPVEIDPYALGVWLADGTTLAAAITNSDPEVITRLGRVYDLRRQQCLKNDRAPVWSVWLKDGSRTIAFDLKALGVWGNKRIPISYLQSSVEQRWALLQGMLDGDGYCHTSGSIEWCSVKKDLAQDFVSLVQSLGMRCTIAESDAKLYGRTISKRYRVTFYANHQPFSVRRNMDRWHPANRRSHRSSVISIESVPSVPTVCIQVDAEDELFLAGDYIVTHNTALMYKTIAHNQAVDSDFICLFVAAESYVKTYAESIGVDTDRLWVLESNEMEPCFELVLKAVENRAVDMVVLDSLPAFVTISEIDKDLLEASQPGNTAKIISTFMKKCRRAQRRSLVKDERGCTLIALNSWRDAIGVKYGDPRTTPGGKAKDQEFFLRVELTRDEWIVEGSKIDDRVGQVIKARTIKNKTAPPQQIGQVDFYFTDTKNGAFHLGEFDTVKDIVNVSIALGVIKRAGGTYTFMDEKWRGKDCAKVLIPAAVREDLDLRAALTKACHEAYAKGGLPPEEDESDEPD